LPKMKGKQGRYHRLEDEREDGVWSTEMDGIGGGARGNEGVYADVSGGNERREGERAD
jgi:hypothetical protein